MGRDDRHPHAVGGLRTREVEEEGSDGIVGMARETTRSRAGPGTTPAGTIRPRHEPSRRCRRAPLVRAGGPVRGGVRRGLRAHRARPRGRRRVLIVVLVIAVGLNVGLLCVLGVVRLPRRARVRPRTAAAQRDRGGRGHGRRRRRDDGDERLGAQRSTCCRRRDPGVYLITGKWLAEQGELPIDAAVGPFADVRHRRSRLRRSASSRRAIPTTRRRRASCSHSSCTSTRRCSAPPTGSAANRLAQIAARAHRAGSRCSRCSCSAVGGCRRGPPRERRSPSRCRSRRRSSAATRSPRCPCSCSSAAGIALAVVGVRRRRATACGRRSSPGSCSARRWRRASTRSSRWSRCPCGCRRAGSSSRDASSRRRALPRHRRRDRHRARDRRPAVAKPPVLRAAPQRDPVAGGAVRCVDARRRARRAIVIPRWRVAALARHVGGGGRSLRSRAIGTVAVWRRSRGSSVRTSRRRPRSRTASSSSSRTPRALVVDSARRYYEHSMEWLSWYLGPVTLARRHPRHRARGAVGACSGSRARTGPRSRARRLPRADRPLPLASARGSRPDVGDAALPSGDDPRASRSRASPCSG